MKIKISEVWNFKKSKTLAVIEVPNNPRYAIMDVSAWIAENRPDLQLANTINYHGYHAIAI